jgi:cyclophilin family peptidyl-prolyl cis-trans isomerase
MTSRTRQKQLARLAARRAEERRRRRRNRAIAVGVGVVVLLGASGAVAWSLLTDEPPAEPGQRDRAQPSAVACGGQKPAVADERKPQFRRPPKLDLRDGADYRAAMVTSCGRIELDLYEDQTPITVNNFAFLAEEGFYDGLTFHRVVRNFVIQGGDPEGTGGGGPGYQFEDEIVKGLKFDRPGLLAMANSGKDTNGSQFFITTGDASHLNGRHTIFGEVIEGMGVVEEIGGFAGPSEAPTKTIYIEKVTVSTS